MEWQDDEFEAFLRQFQPVKPKALSPRRHGLLVLAAAAVLLTAVALPMRFWRAVPAETGVDEAAPSTLPASDATDGKPGSGERRGIRIDAGRGILTEGTTARSGADATAANQRVRVGEGVQPPVRIVNVNPVYPAEAQAAGIEGVVILEIVIGEDGSVIEEQVVQSIPELDQAAIDAVLQWRYEPTLLNGQPVEVEMTVTINFTLLG
ncbi:MAG TPA: energy transducer TonB [Vicinamibacterales bacterium]|jgi:TonB family protein|nr:energy transducer TonB [Vicinamibacterales bacterium]